MLNKLLSGRFIFTIVSAFVFASMSMNGFIDKNDVMQMVMMVAIFYFNRNDRNTPEQPKGV